GQECWQLVSQWVWNLRLELGHQLKPRPVRTTEFAPALPPSSPHTAPASGYASPEVGSAKVRPWLMVITGGPTLISMGMFCLFFASSRQGPPLLRQGTQQTLLTSV
ncbi:MAG TPA: hypothetical protein VHZ51_06265, partial [Ktedonobacteraceae bacterium]|nr:hypothetical protein [Ktedonobacteraceae bacterium]